MDIADVLEGNDPYLTEPEKKTGEYDATDAAKEDMISELFDGETLKETPEEPEEKTEEPEGEQDKTSDETEEEEATEVDFETSSKNAFFNEGELDSERLQNDFLAPEKSFIKDISYEQPKEVEAKPEKTPEETYYNSIDSLMGDLPDLIAQDKEQGFTPEQTIQRLINAFDGYKSELENSKAVRDGIKEYASEYTKELDAIRQTKIDASIDKITAELSSSLDGLIPGVKGSEALNKFVLDKNYGAPIVNHLFMSENPNYQNLNDEEKANATKTWFRSFQANKGHMAIAAEFGRMKWLISQIPEIAKYAKGIGKSNLDNEKSTKATTPSNLNKNEQNNNGMDPKLSEYLGYDSVS